MSLSTADFDGRKLRKPGITPVLFIAAWCPFCRNFSPIFESKLNEVGIEGAYVDLSDDDNPLWDIFGIEIVPTVIVFKDGEIVLREDGIAGRGLSPKVMIDVVRAVKHRQ